MTSATKKKLASVIWKRTLESGEHEFGCSVVGKSSRWGNEGHLLEPRPYCLGSCSEAFYLANSQFYSLDFKSIVARILLINSIYFLMGFSIWPLITHRCQKFDRWACVSTFQNSVRSHVELGAQLRRPKSQKRSDEIRFFSIGLSRVVTLRGPELDF